MPNKFELSKSNRASCKKCKEKIAKDIVRFGEESSFYRDGNEYKSFKWYHFDCAVEKFKDVLCEVEEGLDLLDTEQAEVLENMKSKRSASEFDLKSIADLTGEEGIVNIKGTILRAMNPRELKNANSEMEMGRIVYVQDSEGRRGKVILFSEVELSKGEPLILIKGLARIGNDDNAEVVETSSSQIFFDESDVSLEPVVKYTSKSWDRPSGIYCIFETAPSSRASCIICEEKIKKGELKLIKAVWGENEKTKDRYPRKNSYHLQCAPKDEDAEEFIYEAITRLTPEMVQENNEELRLFLKRIEEIDRPYKILSTIV